MKTIAPASAWKSGRRNRLGCPASTRGCSAPLPPSNTIGEPAPIPRGVDDEGVSGEAPRASGGVSGDDGPVTGNTFPPPPPKDGQSAAAPRPSPRLSTPWKTLVLADRSIRGRRRRPCNSPRRPPDLRIWPRTRAPAQRQRRDPRIAQQAHAPSWRIHRIVRETEVVEKGAERRSRHSSPTCQPLSSTTSLLFASTPTSPSRRRTPPATSLPARASWLGPPPSPSTPFRRGTRDRRRDASRSPAGSYRNRPGRRSRGPTARSRRH